MENFRGDEQDPIDRSQEMKYGEALTSLRKLKGRTIINLSEYSGISLSRLGALESDIDKPIQEEIAIIMKLYGLDSKILTSYAVMNSDILKKNCGELAENFRLVASHLIEKVFLGRVEYDNQNGNSFDN